ncbi:spore germination protein [Neobacillus ginsengisoli]|uniref:Spore germination protein KA n=1 Tax=Neobacillus ginsengisoli TaxID=904295 RepID=A0ABT9Y372_9BACI|nr:spore germination protein [Neobacillus ginsengisoli]MDQ0202285.1 spore germination protein KA [Neobacillus ginsengisoli]
MRFLKKKHSVYKEPQDSILATNDLYKNLSFIKELMCETDDLKVHEFIFNDQPCLLIYLGTLADEKLIDSIIIEPLLEHNTGVIEQLVRASQLNKTSDLSAAVGSLLLGKCIVLEGNNPALYLIAVPKSQGRSIEEPANEKVIKGSHEGFVENLNTNIFLIRQRIKSPQLKVKYFKVGNISNTEIAMIYLNNLVNSAIIKEVETRISTIKIDQLLASGNLEQLIEDTPFSPFPQMLNTERPDRAISNLTEGKICVIVDGDPRILIMPISFFAFYQSSDDYTNRWMVGSFFRFIRLFGFVVAISFPAIYIALVSYHSEILPFGILYSVRVSLQYVPFPPLLEAMVMQTILELLKEASIRLPSPIAQTIGVVGGLVIGTAIVQANLISNTMIVVIGFTAIASFVVPVDEMGTSVRLLGFPMMIMAALFGFFGIAFMFMMIFIHLSKLESFGTPYFAPFAPLKIKDLKDTFLRLPVWLLNSRPTDAKPNFVRQQWYSRVWKKK